MRCRNTFFAHQQCYDVDDITSPSFNYNDYNILPSQEGRHYYTVVSLFLNARGLLQQTERRVRYVVVLRDGHATRMTIIG